MTDLSRRRFLQSAALGAGTLAMSWSSQLWAVPAEVPRVLVVFLRGGYDAANLLVPYTSDDYYRLRPSIAIARPDAANVNAALPLDSDWALHPALKDSLYPFWQRGELAFVPFAGTNDLTRSHFETQDRIELGLPDDAGQADRSGFIGRLVQVLGGPPAITFTGNLPTIATGGAAIPNLSLRDVSKAPFDERQSQLLVSLYRGQTLEERVQEGLQMRQGVAKMFADEMQAANRGAVSANGFEQEARRMGKLMREQYKIGFVDVGGWDTHIYEGGATGQLANALGNLGRGLNAFAQEMQPVWKNTVVIVVSEFGRTFRENGNKGTDHGHGSVYWALGGAVRGGRVLGEQMRVSEATLFQNRDFPVLNEYRGLFGSVFQRYYGLNGSQLDKVFPGARPGSIALL
ncbi:DUF1501 domain-containing protein [Andreprevotia chitinilytica]|uniref:DUF1501 domain-containing protein n=1 Tax=Andreprevotia chitinilytica TaxID=396808 RepID=UPI000552E461|nr:DUF1501 domain-containing protein [Andreprevotia chitinilytica]